MRERGQAIVRLFTLMDVSPPKITDAEQPSGPLRQLSDWRNELVSSRANIIGKPGCYLDLSATGTGKSTADIDSAQRINRGLIIVPTHENGEEVESDMLAKGVSAMKYPGRISDGNDINCWNGAAADAAEQMGLSVVSAVCPHCQQRTECGKSGYLGQIRAVNDAGVAIATHQRAVFNGLNELATGRGDLVSIHEDSAAVMCPDGVASASDLNAASEVLNLILNDPHYLDWLGQTASKDDDGNWVPDEKLAERRSKIDAFVRHLADVVDMLIDGLKSAIRTAAIVIPRTVKKATGTDSLLLRASLELEVKFDAAPWRLLLAAASGELYSIGVIVDDSPNNGKQADDSPKRRTLVGVWRNTPSENAVVLFSDATATKEDLEAYLGRPVTDITPAGHVGRSKRIVQFAKDVTRRTKSSRFLAVVRGVLAEFPDAKKVGVITHRTLIGYLSKIGEPFSPKIVKSAYFGSGSDRASNDWYSQCDLIVVIGTPRVASMAIQRRLIQFGDFGPASENPDWGDIFWRGQTESGQEAVVTNRGYRHPLWNRAHRTLVRAAIIQAAGRGRSLLESGCEVAIVSTEECGFPLADDEAQPIAETELKLLTYLKSTSAMKLPSADLSATYSYNNSKTTQPINSDLASLQPMSSTTAIAVSCGLSERHTRLLLTGMESRRLVARSSDRGGWILAEAGHSLVSDNHSQTSGGQPE